MVAGGCGLIVVAGAGLLQLLGHGRVLWLAVLAVALLGWQAMRRRGTRRQIDHSLLNEMLTVPVLGLGAPAAQIVASESVTHHALLPYLCFNLYFHGSVLLVKMLVAQPVTDPPNRCAGVAVGRISSITRPFSPALQFSWPSETKGPT